MHRVPARMSCCALVVAVACGAPYPATDAAGDWEGMVETPRRPTLLRLHLERADGGWGGSVEIPGAGSVPLSDPGVEGSRVHFVELSRIVALSGNAPDRLFVVTGRATFSAGLYCAAWLAEHTDAVFVGEPVGDALDYWSEGGNIPLPHSGLTVHFANGFHGYSARPYPDREPFFEDLSLESLDVDLPVSTSFDDWRSGRDPALEAIVRRATGLTRPREP